MALHLYIFLTVLDGNLVLARPSDQYDRPELKHLISTSLLTRNPGVLSQNLYTITTQQKKHKLSASMLYPLSILCVYAMSSKKLNQLPSQKVVISTQTKSPPSIERNLHC